MAMMTRRVRTFHLNVSELQPDGTFASRANLYVPRTFSVFLIDRMTNAQAGGLNGILVRVNVTLDPDRYDGASSWNLFEVIDWKTYDSAADRWRPWGRFKVCLWG